MNSFFKKTAALAIAGFMAVSSLCTQTFADDLKTSFFGLDKEASVSKPTFMVKGTEGVRKIALMTDTPGATIYYTANGKTPTTNSRRYTGALLKTTKDVKIKAIAVKGGVSSAVMTKTFRVKTMVGDITGDGKINNNDKVRLKKYLSGITKYVCKDNADCDDNGKLNSRDLTALTQYLDGKIARLPSSPIVASEPPKAYQKKVYGGMEVSFKCDTVGAEIYYTTNGAEPTASSTRYTGPFTLESTKKVKAVSSKNGELSTVKTYIFTVDELSSVRSDYSTSTIYTAPFKITLSNSNSNARILYTLDGSDPRTSSNASLYYTPITINKTTTVTAYAQCKGCSDSEVSTFTYTMVGGFTISGTVWDDTPNANSTPNGKKASDEPGIKDITVCLINLKSSSIVQETKTLSNGTYSFTNIPEGYDYMIGFKFNGQKYRAYPYIVKDGNQAKSENIPAIIIKNTGTYDVSGGYKAPINSYANAISNIYFDTEALTEATFNKSTANVDLALISKNYGLLDLSLGVSGQNKINTETVSNNSELTYTVTVTNKSPITYLNNVTVTFYVSDVFVSLAVNPPAGMKSIPYNVSTENGKLKYTVNGFISGTGLKPGQSVSFELKGRVSTTLRSKIEAWAEVTEYRYLDSCFDYKAIPGNMSGGIARESDEAVAKTLTVVDEGTVLPSTEQSIELLDAGMYDSRGRFLYTLFQGEVYTVRLKLKNINSSSDYVIEPFENKVSSYTSYLGEDGIDHVLELRIKANTDYLGGVVSYNVYLKSNPKKSVTVSFDVADRFY